MEWLSELGRRMRQLFRRKQWEEDLAEEMRLHLDLRAADKGSEALAKRKFGNAALMREESRGVWGWAFWDTLAQDVRYAVRTLAANKGFAAAAILSLTLGIGANTAIFSIVDAVMLRSLPVEDPSRLVEMYAGDGAKKSPYVTNPIWEAVRDRQQAFSGTLAYSPDRFDLAAGGESHFADGLWVSGDFFRMLGVPALRGRIFVDDDDRHGGGRSGPVAVISYAFWQANFGGDPNVLGKTVSLNRHNFEIVGVTPHWFRGIIADKSYDVAIPIGCEPIIHTDLSALDKTSWWWLRMMGRLKAGETLEQANARMNSIAPEINRATLPHWKAEGQARYLKRSFALKSGAAGFSITGTQYKTALFTLMTVVGLVLLIACVNIANLLLARATSRQREISIRLAIGASRMRVIRQLLTESLLLAFAGGICGLLFSVWGARLLVRLLSTKTNQLDIDLSPDLSVLLFTLGIAMFTGIIFGLVPALRATGIGPNHALKENARGGVQGGTRFTLGKALVTGQVALSLMLLAAAGLFLGTLRNFLNVDAGFNPHHVLLVKAAVPPDRLPLPLRTPLFSKILSDLRALPNVRSAASSMMAPVGRFTWNQDAHPEGYQQQAGEEDVLVYLNRVSPGYFKTMEIPLLMGRDFSEHDTLSSPVAMIVGEETARHFWGNQNPIGKTITMEGPRGNIAYHVIGVVKNVKYAELNDPVFKTGFVASTQDPEPGPELGFEIRYDGPVEALIASLRPAIGAINKDATLEIHTLDAQIADSLVQPRLVALLSSFFGLLALLLATIGLYGVISYAAARRRAEIGIRMALGAAEGAVTWLILRDVALILTVGTILGVAVSLIAGRFIKSLLFGLEATNPATLALAAAVLCTAAMLAAYVPARRASQMDPMTALREE
jgi:putative ABC transport system permease protein